MDRKANADNWFKAPLNARYMNTIVVTRANKTVRIVSAMPTSARDFWTRCVAAVDQVVVLLPTQKHTYLTASALIV